jgi:hypothetical protein
MLANLKTTIEQILEDSELVLSSNNLDIDRCSL